ncbi:sugar kinase [Nonomuraea sp. NN258]|uniref:PfkB family carbohydrate kinase n=1 Tax=Nonomuraea antri TaxID=2730852 RepID=UPI001568BAF9|nr:PfkB family carbohydrate kinase [Nonomuraea antri]NRQ32830.1 sugar kinase [Nonomuraea antri]
MRVLGFGDNIVDRFVDRGVDYPGGNSVNVAVYARRLGLEAAYLGVFGDDDLGLFLRESIAAQGVAADHCVVRPGETGISTLRVDDGDRVFLGWNGGGVTVREPLRLDAGLLAYVSSFDLVHSSVYSRSEDELPKLAGGPLVSYDLSSEDDYRTPAYLDLTCPHADLVLLSCSHLDESDTGDLLADAVRRGAGLALGTRGVHGALAYDGRDLVSAPARLVEDPAKIVDTMGCGDAFLAGFAVSLLRDGWRTGVAAGREPVERALDAGAEAAFEQCFVEGAFGHGRAARARLRCGEPPNARK